MNQNRARILPALGVLLLAAIYSAGLFVLKRSLTAANWLGFGFTLLGFLLWFIALCAPSGAPKRGLSALHCLLQLAFGGVAAMLLPLADGLVLAVCAGLLVLYLILAAVHRFRNREPASAEADVRRSVSAMRLLTQEADSIAALAADADLQEKLTALADDLRYSDPISAPELRDLESRIRSNIAILRDEVEDGKAEQARQRVESLRRFVAERNRKCLALKR